MTASSASVRHPITAATLSALCPGVGQVYAGHIHRGLWLVLVAGICGAVGMVAILPAALPTSVRWTASILAAAGALLWIWAIEDARRLARDAGSAYELRDYNRRGVYLALLLLPLPLGVSSAALIRGHVLRAFVVPTSSMAPTIPPGTRLFADMLVYSDQPVRRGDIVVFSHPDDPHRHLIKRVVGLPGERIDLRNGVLHVNGRPLEQRRDGDTLWEAADGREYTISPDTPTDMAGITVPRRCVYVLGDARASSQDSRDFGPVDLRDVVGRVERAFWPSWRSLAPRPLAGAGR